VGIERAQPRQQRIRDEKGIEKALAKGKCTFCSNKRKSCHNETVIPITDLPVDRMLQKRI